MTDKQCATCRHFLKLRDVPALGMCRRVNDQPTAKVFVNGKNVPSGKHTIWVQDLSACSAWQADLGEDK